MKNKINYEEIFFLLIFLTVTIISCNGKNINITDKERLLKVRVQEMCNLIEEGKFKETRKYLIPQWQNKPEQEYKDDLSSLKGMFDYYKIKSIKFRDEIAEVLIDSSMQNEKAMTYDYWIFINDNWYIVDYSRLDPVSSYEIKLYKELIQDNQK